MLNSNVYTEQQLCKYIHTEEKAMIHTQYILKSNYLSLETWAYWSCSTHCQQGETCKVNTHKYAHACVCYLIPLIARRCFLNEWAPRTLICSVSFHHTSGCRGARFSPTTTTKTMLTVIQITLAWARWVHATTSKHILRLVSRVLHCSALWFLLSPSFTVGNFHFWG